MKDSFLNKYKPKFLADFYLSVECNNLIKTLFKMNNLNILFIGCAGTGKTSIIQAIVREYYNIDKISLFFVLSFHCRLTLGWYRQVLSPHLVLAGTSTR